jgi:hypothetical protein
MRTSVWVFLCVASCGLSPALAQTGKPLPVLPGPAAPSLLTLLGETSVQSDLKTTPAQNKQIAYATAKMQADMKSTFGLPLAKAGQKRAELQKSSDDSIAKTLTAAQKKRVKEITLQLQASLAFGDDDVAKALKLSDEQRQKIMAVNDGIGKQLSALFQGKRLPPQEHQKKVAEIKTSVLAEAMKILTSEQSSQWQTMIGSPFRGEVRLQPPWVMPGLGGPSPFPSKN